MKRILLGGVAAIAGLFAFVLLSAGPASAEPAANESQFLVLLNQLRAEKGLGPLAPDAQLQTIARQWSAKMAQDGALSHNPNLPNQVTDWRMIGENVGVGSNALQIHNAFVASPHHYENMVEPVFNFVGIGVVETGTQIWVTVDFKQSKTTVAPPPAPKPAPAPKPTAAPRPAVAPRPAAPRPAAPKAAPKPPVPAPAPPVNPAPTVAPPTTVDPAPVVAGQAFSRPAASDRNASGSSKASRAALGVLAVSLLMIVTRGLVRSRKA
jgi:hypothetical protein